MKNYILITIVLLCLAAHFAFIHGIPSSLGKGQFYPTKGVSDPVRSEVLQCRSIRDVIRRNTARYRKVLIRNDNSMIDFGTNGDNRYMTSRAKSKLDVLASRVQSRWGRWMKLRVEKAWTDVVDRNDMLSLHYEGRTVKVKLSGGNSVNTRSNLGQLCGLALASGFDWVYFESDGYIRISVIPDVCQTKIDMAFVVDGSGSVGVNNFGKVKAFLKDIVDFYNVGFDQTRMALIAYSYTIKDEFLLNTYGTKSQIKAAIDNVYYEGSTTATGSALMRMKNYVFSTAKGMRSDKSIPKVGILITDGRSNYGYDVRSAAKQVKDAGISMFVIGIGSNLNRAELRAVASDPDDEHLFYFGFNDLSAFVDQMSTTSCDEGAQISQCESAETYVDGGSFKYFRGSFASGTSRVTIEIEDRQGKSFLYISTTNKNPGPLDLSGTIKNTANLSPRASSVDLSRLQNKLVYISVQGQMDRNLFMLNIWDSLFQRDKYQATVHENRGLNQFVATIKSFKYGTFEYAIKFGNNAGHFKIDKKTGAVTTTQSLDRESMAQYSLVIVAQDVNLRCHKGRTELVISVADDNDNGPKFVKNLFQFSIREDAALHHVFGLVKATDRDVGSNGKLRYSLISGTGRDDFTLNRDSGKLSVARRLDFETQPGYSLRIRAEDGGSPPKADEADLVINIQNVNEAPSFTGTCRSSCNLNIDEGDVVNRRVRQLTAFDPDGGACILKFAIASSDRSYFAIHETNGHITTKSAIDRETKEVYQLRVIVRDCAKPPLTDETTVTITANDINDNAPRFPVNKYLANVEENQNSGITVIRTQATDLDKGSNAAITYRITAGNRNSHFTINADSGLIATTTPLDREAIDKYHLTVEARDGGSPHKSKAVEVDVTVGDTNDNSPEFKVAKNFQVTENSGRGTFVGQVQVEDSDIGINGRVRCNLYGGNFGNAFSIDATTCRITSVGVIDRETKESYNLQIQATDLGSPQRRASATYTVTIQDENDNSPIFSTTTYKAYIKENSVTGSSVATVSATDKDAGTNAAITYSIIAGDDSVKKFEINSRSGQITLKAPLSFGDRNLYNLKVKAEDGATPPRSGESNVIITVQDTNDFRPVFNPTTYSKRIAENTPRGSNVVRVTATDRDTGPSGQLSYHIESGNVKNAFLINSQTGQISVSGNIDREMVSSYRLTVKAKDNGSPSKSASADVTVTITDVNDNRPTFAKNPFRFQAREDAAVQTSIGKLTAIDRDSGSNAELQYEIVGNGAVVSILANGDVKIAKKLDYEATKSYTYDVKVIDKGSPIMSSYGKLNIQVTDVNDNSPTFAGPFTCEVLENSPASTTVCYVTATDSDSGDNAKISYDLRSAFPASHCPFSIDTNTGDIITSRQLDRESTASFDCTVTATDAGQPSKSSQQNIQVKVKDENDNAPVANPASYKFQITEEQATSLGLGKIIATDRDAEENGRLTYSIKDGSSVLDKFSIDSATGALSAKRKLDRETKEVYKLMVRVTDNGQPSLYMDAHVDVKVMDINDNAPIFGQASYTGRIRENSAAGSKIVQVLATDADAGTNAEISYEIVGGLFSGNFSIGSKTGFILTKNPLDFERVARYELKVRAKDGGMPQNSSTVDVVVAVINVDDNAPEFGKTSEVKVSEGAVIGTPVVKFNATDVDGSSLTYSIKNGNVGTAFEIDSLSGRLKTRAMLDREAREKYNLTVSVKDASSKETIAHVPITVTDINDNAPKFTNTKYSRDILENRGIGYSVLRVKATDRDKGTNAEIVFEIESATEKDSFRIKSNGDIETAKKLDRETHAVHNLVVVAKDRGTPSLRSTVNVEVSIIDENDNAPIFDQVPNKKIAENSGVGATIAAIRATDLDSGTNGQIRYSLPPENGADGLNFEIGESDGVLKTKIDLDREKKDSYTLRIRASDSAALAHRKSTETSLVVTVTDENDNAPVIISPSSIPEVRENVGINTEVVTFKATDADIGTNAEFDFEIVSGNIGDAFRIQKTSGVLTVAKKLDREINPSYQIRIKVEDKGKPSLRVAKTYQVDVKDVNDNKPEFTLSKFKGSVDENVPIGTNVVNVSATDADVGSNAAIVYRFSSSTTAATFYIDQSSGQINTAAKIDYEATPEYRFNVTASDGKFSTETEVEIEVLNLNDNNPKFEKAYFVNIAEDKDVSSSVVTVTASDLDSFGMLSYTLLNNTASFSIDSQTGEIQTTVGLDREKKSYYAILVKVEDGGSPKRFAETTAIVSVSDINDNAPYFKNLSAGVNVTENTDADSFFTVVACDKDIGINAQLEYEILAGTGSDKFRIDPSTGRISTAVKLDREKASSYTMNIIAKDKGSPSLASQPFVLSISVSDVNDNSPFFVKAHNNEKISEGAGIGVEVFQVVSSDLDIGMNAEVLYNIGGGNADDMFTIDKTTGVVSVKRQLDREKLDRYQIEVIAADRGTPSLRNSTRASISILDDNDNIPEFDNSTLIGQIFENQPVGSSVCTVVATDKDLGENARLTYSLNANDAFSIDPTTGEVKTLKTLDREETAQYKLQLSVTDHGRVPLSRSEELTINVLDIDDNCPVFSPKVYNVTIEENLPYGTIVLNVTATDKDSGTNAELQYAIKEGDDQGGFSIDRVTGAIKIFGTVDREYSDRYLLKVRAGKVDCGVKQSNESNVGEGGNDQNNFNHSLAEVHIHLTDKNDNAPIFSRKVFYYDFKDVMAKELMNVTARDPDLSEGGKVTFRLLSSQRADKNGEERREVKVEAGDRGTPPMKSNSSVFIRNKTPCEKMSFQLTESGTLSTTTLCSFTESPSGSFMRLVGEPFSLSCVAQGNDEIHYRWSRDGNSIAAFTKSGVLEINAVTKDDQGTYECLARNGAGTVSAPTKATLVIKEKPTIFKHPVGTTAETGGYIAFSCDATGDPAPRFQWRKNGEIYQAGQGYKTNTLVLANVIMNDVGVYYCEAINSVGTAESRKATLKVVERGSVVSLKLSVENPKSDGACHFFLPSAFENLVDSITKKKTSVTKYDPGKFCNVTKCEPNPCENDGKCELTRKSYHCSCKRGWQGLNCMDDIDECSTGIGSCRAGKCQNVKGSYWCNCPLGRAGRNCQHEDSVCQPNPCAAGEMCLSVSPTTGANYTCVAKKQGFSTMVKMTKERGWESFRKYDIEDDLNLALQNWKSKSSRLFASSVDFTPCTIRVTSVKDTDSDVAKVEYVILCPGNGSRHIPSLAEELCSLLLDSIKNADNCMLEGSAMTTRKPEQITPAVEVDIEIVIRDDSSGTTLSAREAVDLMNQKDVRNRLEAKKFKVSRVNQAYFGKAKKEDNGDSSSATTIGVVIGVLALIAIAVFAVYFYISKKKRGSLEANLTMTDRIAQRGNSKEDLLRSDIMMSNVDQVGIKNESYGGDRASHIPIDESFMIDVSSQMKKNQNSEKKTEQYESLPWYKGARSEKEVESSFSECTTPGAYLAYESDHSLFIGIKASDEVIHLPVKRTPAGGFLVKYGNNEGVARDNLMDVIEHFQVSPLNLGDGTAEVVLTEPWLRTSIL